MLLRLMSTALAIVRTLQSFAFGVSFSVSVFASNFRFTSLVNG